MGRRKEEEANHWPGFVDALSTIVMVVTFLLIILAIVIFVMSQSIAQSYIESMSEQTQQGGGDMYSPDPMTASDEFIADVEPTAEPIPDALPPSAPTTEQTETDVAVSDGMDVEPIEQAQPSPDQVSETSETTASESTEPNEAEPTPVSSEPTPAAEAPLPVPTPEAPMTPANPEASPSTPAPQAPPSDPAPAPVLQAPAMDPAPEAPPPSPNPTEQNIAESNEAENAEEAQTGEAFATRAESVLSDTPDIDADEFAVRSQRVIDQEERIAVATPDLSDEDAETIIRTSAAVLTVEFDPVGTRLDEEAQQLMNDFISRNEGELADRKITIWGFTSYDEGSISQSRRMAYYRALESRNVLLRNGFSPENIQIEIRPAVTPEDTDTVRLTVVE